MPSWKRVITSGSDASLNTLTVTNGVTGSLEGTASFAVSASWAPSVTIDTSSFATTGSNQFNDSQSISGSLNVSQNVEIIGILNNGNGTVAIGNSSHAEGYITKTGGTNGYLATSVASGLVTLDSSYGDVTADYLAGDYLLIDDSRYANTLNIIAAKISSSSFNGSWTTVFLEDISITSAGSAVVGNLTLGSGNWAGTELYGADFSHAEGTATQAIGYASHTEGRGTQTIGDASHAEGRGTQTIGGASHAEGYGTKTLGEYSHTEGYGTKTLGEASHAEGLGTIASGSYQHVSGKYNTHGDDTSLFIIGNGVDDSTRSDVFRVTTTNVQVTGSLDVTQGITGSLFGTASFAVSASWAPGGTIDTSSFATTGSNTFIGDQIISGTIYFGDGSAIQSISASSGDGGGLATLTLKPDASIASDQYVVLDPTTPNHIHIRAGGLIDSSSAYLYLGGEKANIVVRNLDDSFDEKFWVQINSQTGSTQNTWIFDNNGDLIVPGNISGVLNLSTSGSNTFIGPTTITGSITILGDGSNDTFQIYDSGGTKQLYIDNTNQFSFNADANGPVYFGAFNNPSAGLVGFSVPGNVTMGISANTLRTGFGGAGAHFATTEPNALVEVRGKVDEIQLVVQGDSAQTVNLQEWRDSTEAVLASVSLDGTITAPAITGSSVLISGSGANVTRLLVVGSGSIVPIFTVQGSQGELFSITDSLSGSLFSVNDISGLPILEVFSDNTTLIGDYAAPALITTTKNVISSTGEFTVYSIPTASYDGAFYDYTIKSGANARAGQITAIWNGTDVNYTETTTIDFGSTTDISLGVFISGSDMVLTGSAATSGWTMKTIIRSI
jgi:hypothetical protein